MEKEIEALAEAAKKYSGNGSATAASVQGAAKSYTGNRHTHRTLDATQKHSQSKNASRSERKMRKRSPSDASIEGCSSDGEDSNSSHDDDDDGDDDTEEGPLVSLEGVELDKDAQPPPIEEILASKPDAFRWFCSAHLHTPALKMNKKSLQKKVDHAKTLAQRINAARSKIANLTQDVQRLRLAAKAQRISSLESKTRRAESKFEDPDGDIDCTEDDESSGHVPSEEETAALRQIAAAKREYKEGLVVLKKVKKEVGTIQELISTNTKSIKEQFKVWYGRVLDLGEHNERNAHEEAAANGASSGKRGAEKGSSLREPASSASAGEGKRSEARVPASNDVNALFLAARSELLARKNGK